MLTTTSPQLPPLPSLGDPRVVVAVLDGPVDLEHPCLREARLRQLGADSAGSDSQEARRHGTHVASQIFAQPDCGVIGVAPRCSGLVLSVFAWTAEGKSLPTSQVELARAIRLAVDEGANIINISGGQLSPTPDANSYLADALAYCEQRNVLVVAATGNNGCACTHIPAGLSTVLAVGALDPATGRAMPFSNWGDAYQGHGILAPGKDILGAKAGGGTRRETGTSFAAPVVSGVAAQLWTVLLERGLEPRASMIREALVRGARPCGGHREDGACHLYLDGSLAPAASLTLLLEAHGITEPFGGDRPVPVDRPQTSTQPRGETMTHSESEAMQHNLATAEGATPSAVEASGCACKGESSPPPRVFALGQLGYDLVSEARRDSLQQSMGHSPHDWKRFAEHLASTPWDAEAVTWTLSIDATPIYALRPWGPYAAQIYRRLADILVGQLHGAQRVERVSVPGLVAGNTRLMNGATVPVIVPSMRGLYAWDTAALTRAVVKEEDDAHAASVANFFERVYHELRNLGQSPQERAINFAATNAFQVERVFHDASDRGHELDLIEVEKSPICRPDSDCWDVKLTFFDPQNDRAARRVHRFTVDVSDVVPCTVGATRSWSVR